MGLLETLLTLLVVLLVLGLIWYAITLLPLPVEVQRIAQIVFVVICIIVLIYMFLPISGHVLRC